jgi:SAM-dependent methyltransferase
MMDDNLPELPAGALGKQDDSDDLTFYAPPRLVTHIDDRAITALTAYYRAAILPQARVLDLMSSWVSHLPPECPYAEVVGHGMNAQELAANSRLDSYFIQDLNREVRLPLDDQTFDAALCCVGAQYLQHPVSIFSEVRRVLTPGAPFIVSFSNRCFPTKAVAIWLSLDTPGHAALVRLYLERAGFDQVQVAVLSDGSVSDPLVAVVGRA